MEYIILAVVGFLTSLLTFFSGFGLGTLLTPVFIFFFPLDQAIAMTAIVHFINNLFKLSLLYRYISLKVLLYFGPFCIVGAFFGALLLLDLSDVKPLYNLTIFDFDLSLKALNLLIGTVMIGFAILEFNTAFALKNISSKLLWLGGLLSGFFGGLSGHQGALRSMFLIKSNLGKEQFIASGVAIACLVDITRISIYSEKLVLLDSTENLLMIAAALIPALLGAVLGKKLLKKVTLEIIHKYVAWMLIFISIGIITGLF
ncbi:MAG: sulfite exporter TauE/SafE family protein [Cytophagales bacterium]